MSDLILATGSDLKYLSKIDPYLNSVNKFYTGEKVLFFIEQDFSIKVSNIHGFNVRSFPLSKMINKNPINCIQHGEFINDDYFKTLSDSTVILFTDGDILMQRSIDDSEKSLLNLGNDEFLVGYNASENDNLLDEANRLQKISSIYDYKLNIENWKNIKCYNTGVLAGNLYSWKKLFLKYSELWSDVDKTFVHYAKQQWLICLLLHKYFNVKIMPYSFHTHGHYPLPIGTYLDNNYIYDKNGKIILLRHKC